MHVVAIANQKGGVGKTTTAVNLGASLGVLERRTLLIDLDPQANASSASGVDMREQNRRFNYHVLLGEVGLEEIALPTSVPHFFVAPSGPDLIGFEIEGISLPEREMCLRKAIEGVKNQYDVILIDCPPSLGLLTLNALCAAEGVLVPLQCEYLAMEGLGRLTHTVELVRTQLNRNLILDGIVLTMFDRRNSLAHQVATEVEKHFGSALWRTRIPRNVRLSEAPSFGKPIILYDIRSVGAQSYLSLAEEFVARLLSANSQISIQKEGVNHDRTESAREGDRISHSKSTTTELR